NRSAVDAIIAISVLLDRPTREPDVVPGTGARVVRAWCLQEQLRHLPAVDWQVLDLSRRNVHADVRGAEIENRRRAHHGYRFLHADRLQLEVKGQLLTDGERHRGIFDWCESLALNSDRISGRPERDDQEVTLIVGCGRALLASPLVLDSHRDTVSKRTALI